MRNKNKDINEILESYRIIGGELARLNKMMYSNEWESEGQSKLSDLNVEVMEEMNRFVEMLRTWEKSELYKF